MNKRYWSLVALVSIFLLPFLVAWYLYLGGWRPEIQSRGVLYAETRPMPPSLRLLDDKGQELSFGSTRQWTLLQGLDSPCLDECRAEIQVANSVYTRLHKDALRVRHALWGYEGDPPLRPEYGILPISSSDDEALADWLGNPALPDAGTWIISPQGHVVLCYARPLSPADIFSDIKKLISRH